MYGIKTIRFNVINGLDRILFVLYDVKLHVQNSFLNIVLRLLLFPDNVNRFFHLFDYFSGHGDQLYSLTVSL